VLVSKVIQTMSNQILFGAKEAFMMPLNDFIREHQSQVDGILIKLAVSVVLMN
jgi:hypothetical protein